MAKVEAVVQALVLGTARRWSRWLSEKTGMLCPSSIDLGQVCTILFSPLLSCHPQKDDALFFSLWSRMKS